MLWVLISKDRVSSTAGTQPIVLYCAASNRAVVEEIRSAYEKEFGRSIQIQYGPSQTLLSSLEVSGDGDLYLPADDSFLKIAKDKQLVAEVLPIATMQVGIAVSKGNPKHIQSFDDLLRKDVRVVQANPDAAAVATLTQKVLQDSGTWSKIESATSGFRTTVNDVANDVLVGAADAGIVYDAVLHTYPGLEFVALPEFSQASSQVAVGVIAASKQPTAALHFARYLTATDRGLLQYAEHGFQTKLGDQWSDVPELSIFAGSMLQPAIEETIVEFEKREGIRVSRVYNGCGILVGQMKGGQCPDAYFACDTEFMNQVADLFPDPVPVSQNELVILVQKGNPHNVTSLQDLTRKGLRVGIGHEKQCAMGWITQRTFTEGGLKEEIMPNVTVELPTGDLLVNQMRAGALDVAVVYLSNAAGAGDELEAYKIEGLDCSVANQPWAVAAQSKYPRTAERLFEAICSTKSQEIFASEGFRWQLPE
jgi:molybdenum ABC transporter molybdate-binding protein